MKKPFLTSIRLAGVLALATVALLAPGMNAHADTTEQKPSTDAKIGDISHVNRLEPTAVPPEIHNKANKSAQCGKFPSGSLLCVSAAAGEPVTVWYDNKATTQTVRLGMSSTSETSWRVGSPVLAPVNKITGAQWSGLANGCYTGLIFLPGETDPWATPTQTCVA